MSKNKNKNEEVIDEKEEKIEEETPITDSVEEEKSDTFSSEEYNALEEKYKKIENTYQRLLADYENHKRRTAQEVIDAKNKGKIEVFEQLLDIIDNFERSMQFDIQTEEFKTGIEMVHKMFDQKLKAAGLSEVETTGLLNPSIHQAIMVDEVEDKENDEILDVLQKGYCVEEKIIRPAMVKVNKKD